MPDAWRFLQEPRHEAAGDTPSVPGWQARGSRARAGRHCGAAGHAGSRVQGAGSRVQGAVSSAPVPPSPRLGPPLTSPHLHTAGKFGTLEELRVPALVPQLTVQAQRRQCEVGTRGRAPQRRLCTPSPQGPLTGRSGCMAGAHASAWPRQVPSPRGWGSLSAP